MADQLDDIAASLRRWLKYFLGNNLYGSDPDPQVVEQLRSLGELVDEVRESKPERFDIAADPGSDPIEILRQALQPQFGPEDLVYPDDDVAILFSGLDVVADELLAQQDEDSKPIDDGADKFAPEDNAAPEERVPEDKYERKVPKRVPERRKPPPDVWRVSLFLRKIHCAKETSPVAFTDDFRLFGNYIYGAKRGSLQDVQGQFDTNTQKSFVDQRNPHGRLLATELIPATTEFTVFDTTIIAFEDDGMTASGARILAGILGNLATLGVNGLLTSAQASGVNVPPQAKQAYDNLGLPGLIGVLAKAFGPEPFLPVKAYAKTKWPPGAPANPPEWIAKIPNPGGRRQTYSGEANHDGNVTMVEATLEESASPQGATDTVLVGLTDGGKYYIYLRYRVERD